MKYVPDLETFHRLAEGGRWVPVYRERQADLETPVSVFMKLAQKAPAFLLESVERGIHIGRYSFIGTNPSLIIESRGMEARVLQGGQVTKRVPLGLSPQGPDPLEVVKQVLSAYPVSPVPGLPRFYGGAVGFLGYDAVRFFERLPQPPHDELNLPDAIFLLSDMVVIFDHLLHQMKVVCTTPGDGYQQAMARIDAVLAQLSIPLPPEDQEGEEVRQAPEWKSNMTPEQYSDMVRHAREYIYAGDIFQVVLSHRLRRPTKADGFSLYRALRMVNPSPYMFYLDFGPFQLIGSSPEMLVRLEEGRAETRPIAGTYPRGKTEEEDEAISKELLADPKERAEHIMLVDLGRNDIGRVCRPGTVRIPLYMGIEKYSHVIHIVSAVEGMLRPEYNAFSLLRSCFPAGTLSGAPKIRAMEIIAEMEGTRRGPYGGAVGYFGFGGNMDTCITIRTIVKIGEMAYLQAGGGIVAGSVPEREWEETLRKMAALSRAVEVAERGSF